MQSNAFHHNEFEGTQILGMGAAKGAAMNRLEGNAMNTASQASMPPMSYPDWFCLRPGRENFHIDPDRDHEYLFGKSEWKEDIDARLRRVLALREPVRLVWWGQYGIGKTHRLKFMDFWIRYRKLDLYPVHVVCRDIEEKSSFSRLHYDLVNNLGRERMQPMVAKYIQRLDAGDSSVMSLTQLTTSPDIVGAVQRFAISASTSRNDENMQLAAWKFLTGGELDSKECSLAGVTREAIDSSVEYAGVLRVFGAIITAETGQQVVYLLDQVEALSKIRQRSVEGRWIETLRAVLDVRNVGVVMAIGAEHRFDELPSIMVAPEIIRRFTINNYIGIGAFKRDQTSEFLEGLLHEWVDASKRDALAATEEWQGKVPDYDPSTYPLTKRAFETLCRFCSDELDHKTAKPSEIIEQMNRITYEAYSSGRRLIDETFLKTQGITA